MMTSVIVLSIGRGAQKQLTFLTPGYPFSFQNTRGLHGLTEFVIKRPDTETVYHYMVYRAFDHLICKEGYIPFVMETVEIVRALLLAESESLKRCIDRILDEGDYRLNRVTHRGLNNFIMR